MDSATREYAAVLGRRYLEGTVTAEALFEHFGDIEDPLIVELLVAIANEPRRGFWGVRESRWQKSFKLPVMQLLAELERGEEGRIPQVAVASVNGWRLFGLAFAILWVGALAVEHSLKLWWGNLPAWRLAIHALMSVTFGVVVVAGVYAFKDWLGLYRYQRTKRRSSDESD